MEQSSPRRRGPWSSVEDQKLLALIEHYRITQGRVENWVKISEGMVHRTPKQCRERYTQNLAPGLNHTPISLEEGVLIQHLVEKKGKRWAEIARSLNNNRSDNAVKNWWNGSQNRRKRNEDRQAQRMTAYHQQQRRPLTSPRFSSLPLSSQSASGYYGAYFSQSPSPRQRPRDIPPPLARQDASYRTQTWAEASLPSPPAHGMSFNNSAYYHQQHLYTLSSEQHGYRLPPICSDASASETPTQLPSLPYPPRELPEVPRARARTPLNSPPISPTRQSPHYRHFSPGPYTPAPLRNPLPYSSEQPRRLSEPRPLVTRAEDERKDIRKDDRLSVKNLLS